mmetsp:Transcript_10464/g.25860  ORF Transcript_10464/g.25860 Transcript_10464/m.25860 type:complete len:315 (+) Transcript_10464:556-1500(+)
MREAVETTLEETTERRRASQARCPAAMVVRYPPAPAPAFHSRCACSGLSISNACHLAEHSYSAPSRGGAALRSPATRRRGRASAETRAARASRAPMSMCCFSSHPRAFLPHRRAEAAEPLASSVASSKNWSPISWYLSKARPSPRCSRLCSSVDLLRSASAPSTLSLADSTPCIVSRTAFRTSGRRMNLDRSPSSAWTPAASFRCSADPALLTRSADSSAPPFTAPTVSSSPGTAFLTCPRNAITGCALGSMAAKASLWPCQGCVVEGWLPYPFPCCSPAAPREESPSSSTQSVSSAAWVEEPAMVRRGKTGFP